MPRARVAAVDPSKGDLYIKDGAYTTWLNFDPHASAYDVLLDSRSVAIAEKLKGPLKNEPAHKAELCLSCHSTTSPPDPISPGLDLVKNGISCEACHGGAEVWNDKHLVAGWRSLPADKKALDGMMDLSTPGARAKLCVECHVGQRLRGMDMNHDLIAAGHPRLNFEFASYQAAYPKHWKEKHEKAPAQGAAGRFEAKSWAVGQVVTARAVLELLAGRAEASKDARLKKGPGAPRASGPSSPSTNASPATTTWPTQPAPECRATSNGRPGKLPWATWPLAMVPDLAGIEKVELTALAKLRIVMEKVVPDEDEVARLAKDAIQELDKLILALERGDLDAADRRGLADEGAGRPHRSSRRELGSEGTALPGALGHGPGGQGSRRADRPGDLRGQVGANHP